MTAEIRPIPAIILFCLLSLAATQPLAAQEVLPDAPKELEDFRLDAPPKKNDAPAPLSVPPSAQSPAPLPAQKPEEQVSARPEVQATPTWQATAPGAPDRSVTRQPAPQPAPRQTAAQPAEAPAPSDQAPDRQLTNPESNAGAASEPQILPAQQKSAEQPSSGGEAATAAEEGDDTSPLPLRWIFLALALFAGILAVFFALRLKQSRKRAEENIEGAELSPAELMESADDNPHVAEAVGENVAAFKAALPSKLPSPSQEKGRAAPPRVAELEMRFEPAEAILGMAALTLRGQFKIVNHGKAAARNVKLRSAALCANARQAGMIAQFNAGLFGPDADNIADIAKGERVNIDIEISLPRSELTAFDYAGQKLCVPLVLAQLVWQNSGADDTRNLDMAVLVGREADPPQAKMGALRLDRGPRNFSMLGQRPLPA